MKRTKSSRRAQTLECRKMELIATFVTENQSFYDAVLQRAVEQGNVTVAQRRVRGIAAGLLANPSVSVSKKANELRDSLILMDMQAQVA
jgi:hypothetical protein